MKQTLFRYIILFIFLLAYSLQAQEKERDSIERILSSITSDKESAAKLDKLVSSELDYASSELRLYFIKKAIRDSKKKKDTLRLLSHYIAKSRFFTSQLQGDSSYIYAEKALELAKSVANDTTIIMAWRNVGNVQSSDGDYTKAMSSYQKALEFAEGKGLKNSKEFLLTQFNLGSLYYEIDENEKSERIYKALYENPVIKKDIDWHNETGYNYATTLFVAQKYDELLAVTNQLIKNETRMGFLAYIYGAKASAHLGLQQFDEALQYNQKAITTLEDLGDKFGVLGNKLTRGDIYVDMGRYSDAENVFSQALKDVLQMNDPPVLFIENIYGALGRVYTGKKDYKKALQYVTKQYQFKDSIKGVEEQNTIRELEVKYDTEKTKREKEAALAETSLAKAETERNRIYLIGAVALGLLILIASLFYFKNLKTQKKAEVIALELKETQKRLALEKQYRDSELKALKAQMNPHFIFNALNSIQEYIILNKKNLAGDYLGKFADLMRTYLHHSDKGTLTIQEEIDSLKMYLELEALRFEETLYYTIEHDTTLAADTLHIPTMLVQPYIENALKHGLLHKKTDRKLNVHFTNLDKNTIQCQITDNGVGRAKAELLKKSSLKLHKSFATKATESRLNLLNFGKKRKIGVQIEDWMNANNEPLGTRVTLTIPVTINGL